MRNQEIKKGLLLIAEGFTTLANAYDIKVDMTKGEDKTVMSTINKKEETTPILEPKEEVKETPQAPLEEAKETTQSGEKLTEAELNSKSYNEIKAIAKELGVKAVGSKKSIIVDILEYYYPVATEEQVDHVEETIEEQEETAPQDVQEAEEAEEIEDINDEDNGTLYDQVAKDLHGYSDEELADILSEVGVSPKGKRQALLAKIVQAIEEGKLEWESEEAETQEETPVQEEEEIVIDDETDDSEEEIKGSETRQQAWNEEWNNISDKIERQEISHKEVMKFLKEYFNGQYVSQGESNDYSEYATIQCELVDDEGVKHDLADPYYVGDDIHCCAKQLSELKDGLYCEICGTEYEV